MKLVGSLGACCLSPVACLRAAARERRQVSAIRPHVPRGTLRAFLPRGARGCPPPASARTAFLALEGNRFGLLGPKNSRLLADLTPPSTSMISPDSEPMRDPLGDAPGLTAAPRRSGGAGSRRAPRCAGCGQTASICRPLRPSERLRVRSAPASAYMTGARSNNP